METSILNGMCRCCALEGTFKDLKCTYHWMGEQEIYGDMLKECFNIDLSNEDGTDSGICEVCITQLRNAVNFKKQVLFTEEQFKKKVQGKFFKANIVKVEVQQDEADSDDNDNNLSTDEAFSNTEFEVPIKMEEPEEPKAKKRAAAKATTSRAKKAKTDAGETSKRMAHTRKKPAIRRRAPYNTNTFKNKINVDTLLIHSNATLIRVKNAKGYSCMFCREQFIEPSDLKKHAVEEHSSKSLVRKKTSRFLDFPMKMDITGLRCKLCDRSVPKLTDLMAYLQVEHKKELFSDLKSQIVPFKFETKEMTCVVCNNEFSTFKQLQEHMNSHFPNYVCEICGAGFITRTLQVGHKKSHESSGEFKCGECDKTFPTIKKRRLHLRRAHFWSGKVIKCNYCEERFVDYWKKMEHLTKAHGVPALELKCQACDQIFNNRRTLARHTKRDHLMERKHECQECDKKFFERKSLQEHMTKHTGVTEIFQCDICSKTYTRRKTLREHIKIHSDVKQFNCKHCSVGFTQKYAWKTHMRTKHDEIV